MKRNIFLFFIFSFLLFACASPDKKDKKKENTNDDNNNNNPTSLTVSESSLEKGFPKMKTNDSKFQKVKHLGYTLSYNEDFEQANWVAYILTKNEVEKRVAERNDNFRSDPDVTTGSAIPDDYKSSGYDRGHLAPAADMSWSEEAMSESFFMSNMSPQTPELNRGIWRVLEETVREWAIRDGALYIVTGPVLSEKPTKFIGKKNKVGVPKKYYKVILDINSNGGHKAIGFIFDNKGSDKDIFDFACSIDEVEKVTGINFFADQPDNLMDILEKSFKKSEWEKTSKK